MCEKAALEDETPYLNGNAPQADQVDRVVSTRADSVSRIRPHGLGQPYLPDDAVEVARVVLNAEAKWIAGYV